MLHKLAVFVAALAPALAAAQSCPDKSVLYWQAFPAGGESDISARHQQLVLKKRCPAIETIIQYKPGAGGALLWTQANALPADGVNIYGINLPHTVLQPMEGQVQYKTEDLVPVYWYHYTPDALVVPESSPYKTFKDFVAAAKAQPEKISLGGSGLNSANHAAHVRLNNVFGFKTTYVPFKGTGDMTTAVLGGHVAGAMSYTAFAINNKGKVRALAVAMDKRHPLLPEAPTFKTTYVPFKGTGDMTTAVLGGHVAGAMSYTAFAINNKGKVRALAVAMDQRHPLLPEAPTFKELGVDWVDGAFRGIGMPKSSTLEQRKRMSDLWAALNADPEMKQLAAKSGFELVDIGVEKMDAFMKDKIKVYSDAGRRMGLGAK